MMASIGSSCVEHKYRIFEDLYKFLEQNDACKEKGWLVSDFLLNRSTKSEVKIY